MTRGYRASYLAVGALLSVAALAGGQQPGPAPTPTRTQRVLAVGNVVFPGQWKPIATVGGLWQLSLTPTRVTVDEFGAPRITPPRWYLHTLLSGGASFDKDNTGHDVTATGHAQLGVVRRNDSALTSWGPVLHFSSSPRTYGGALRVEFMDNVGLEIGLAHLDRGSRDRLMVSIDYFKKLCQDLGFGMSC